jgi:hypothetical protein
MATQRLEMILTPLICTFQVSTNIFWKSFRLLIVSDGVHDLRVTDQRFCRSTWHVSPSDSRVRGVQGHSLHAGRITAVETWHIPAKRRVKVAGFCCLQRIQVYWVSERVWLMLSGLRLTGQGDADNARFLDLVELCHQMGHLSIHVFCQLIFLAKVAAIYTSSRQQPELHDPHDKCRSTTTADSILILLQFCLPVYVNVGVGSVRAIFLGPLDKIA